MSTAYLGLGSNMGNRAANIRNGLRLLQQQGVAVTKVSPAYETEPVVYTEQRRFLNAACAVSTHLPARELLALIKRIEVEAGRTPTFQNGPRVLDIDLLLYGNVVINDKDAQVPHPRMHTRAFVLMPLAAIAPRVLHPLLGKTVGTLAKAVDAIGVRRAPVTLDKAGSS